MARTLRIQVRAKRVPLSRAAEHALRNLSRYDLIVFTSKNAKKFFIEALGQQKVPVPRARMFSVGPRADLLKLPISNKRILFPRSALAPRDIVRRMRKRAASVRAITLYTATAVPLTKAAKASLLAGKVDTLYFRSPSGVTGLLQQFRTREKPVVQRIPAECIGATTARAARAAGFKRVSATGVL